MFARQLSLAVASLLVPVFVHAAEPQVITLGELFHNHLMIVWMAVCAALLFFMRAGFLLRELGLVRSKNAVNAIMKTVAELGVGSLGFWLVGFGLMYGVNASGWIGSAGVDTASSSVSVLFQLMLATVVATIVSGAVAERAHFLPYVVAAFCITTFVYPIYGGWAWSATGDDLGWLKELGFHDAAGATVVHSMGGWCALGALIVLGPREGRFSRKGAAYDMPGHNLPLMALGSFILWFTWFGFTGARINGDFTKLGAVLLNTHLGGVGGICGVIAFLGMSGQGFYMTRVVNGALAGLVAVSAGVDVFGPHAALLVGFIGGIILCASTNLLYRFRIDDVISAVPIHGFSGAWGTLAVGFFYQGDMFSLERIIAQIVGIFVAFVWGVSVSFGLFWVINRVSDLRVSSRLEQHGLDISEHDEIAYNDFVITDRRADS